MSQVEREKRESQQSQLPEWFSTILQDIQQDIQLRIQSSQEGENLIIPLVGFETFLSITDCYADRKDKQTIATAYILASWAHAKQYRKTGEAYIHHPLEVARFATTDHINAEAISAFILHDVLEDSGKEDGNLVTETDLERFFSAKQYQKIITIVKGLTNLNKLEDPEASFEHLYKESMKDPMILLGKLYDRIHNLLTIQGFNPAKQYEKSIQTLQALLPVAKLFGFRKQARILGDLAYSIIDTLKNGSTTRIAHLNSIMDEAYTDDRQASIYSFFKQALPFDGGHFRLSAPSMYELAIQLQQETTKVTLPKAEDCWYTIEMAIPREHTSTEQKFALYASTFILSLPLQVQSQDNKITFPEQVGLSKAVMQGVTNQSQNGLEYTVLFQHDDKSIQPLRIRIYQEEKYHQRTTPQSVHDASALPDEIAQYTIPLYDRETDLTISYTPDYYRRLTLEQAKRYATKSLYQIRQFAKDVEQGKDLTWKTYLERIQLAQPDGIKVIGQKRNGEQAEVYIPPNSTILDYAMIWLPNSWYKIKSAVINGKITKDLDTLLSPNDTIHLIFAKGSNVTPEWLSSTRTVTQKLPDILSYLREKEAMLYKKNKVHELEQFRQKMMREGQKRLIAFLSEPIGPVRLNTIPKVNELGIKPNDLLIRIAYRDPFFNDELLQTIADQGVICWKNQIQWIHPVNDDFTQTGVAETVLRIFRENGLIITTFRDDSFPFTPDFTQLAFWFDPTIQANKDLEERLGRIPKN